MANNSTTLSNMEDKYSIYGSPDHDVWFWVYFIYTNVICVSGCGGYILFFLIVIRFKDTTFQNTFYNLAMSLAIPDCGILMLHVFYATPSAIWGESNVPRPIVYMSSLFSDWCFWSAATHIVVIGFNRLAAVIWVKDYQRFFTKGKVALLIIASYILGSIMPLYMFGCSCIIHVPSGWGWEYTCGGPDTCADFSLQLNQILDYLFICAVIVIYFFIFIRLRNIRKKVAVLDNKVQIGNQIKKERSMIYQCGLIVLVLILSIGSFWVIPSLVDKGTIEVKLAMCILNTFVLLNSSINPFLYLTFGSDVRNALKSLFGHHCESHAHGEHNAHHGQRTSHRQARILHH